MGKIIRVRQDGETDSSDASSPEVPPALADESAARFGSVSSSQLATLPDNDNTDSRTNTDNSPKNTVDTRANDSNSRTNPDNPRTNAAANPTANPAEKPAEKPAENPAEKPARLWPSGRHGRHARGSEARPGRHTSLSIRSAESRSWSANLSGPGPAGLVIHGLGGIGKSTLAAQIATRVSRLRSGHVVTTLSGEVTADSFPAEPTDTDLVILDTFDDNLTQDAGGWTVRDPALAALLAAWPGKLLITCRRPFTLVPALPAADARPVPHGVTPILLTAPAVIPAQRQSPSGSGPFSLELLHPTQPPQSSQPSHPSQTPQAALAPQEPHTPHAPHTQASRTRSGRDRLVFRQLGPLTRSGAWEYTSSLPAIRMLLDSERDHVWRITGGHPLALEYLDSLLALGSPYPELAERIATIIRARTGQPLPGTEPTAWPEATATLIAEAAGDQLIGELFAKLSVGARTLLVRASVFRMPVAPDVLAARPGQISEVQAAGLLTAEPAGPLSVHRWTAERLHRCLAGAGLGARVVAAHEQAASYWRSGATADPASPAAPAGTHPELEAGYHERQAAEVGPAERVLRPTFAPPESGRRSRVLRITVASAVAAIAAVATVLAVEAAHGPGVSHPSSSGLTVASAPVTQAAAVRARAAAWAVQQVSGGAIMACDPAMCAVLSQHGIAAGNLLMLGPGASDPLGSDVVLATAAVRNMFGSRLTSVYAPEVLASFGTGQARIDVRVVAPEGAAAYRAGLAADLQARRLAGAQLLRDHQLTFDASARTQLTAGQVDARLLITLDTLAASEPVRIEAFAADGPGASPGLPLRTVQLSVAPGAVGHVLAFFRAQRSPYLAARTSTTAAGSASSAITVEFAAPAPLDLLQPSS